MRTRHIAMLLYSFILAMTSNTAAQQSVGSISLTAILPSTVRLSDNWIPVSIRVGDDRREISFPLEIQWNVGGLAKQIQIIAYFPDATSALGDRFGHTISASNLEIRSQNSDWKVFPEVRRTVASSGVLLMVIDVSEARQAGRRTQFKLCVHGDTKDFIPGEYYGRVQLRTAIR